MAQVLLSRAAGAFLPSTTVYVLETRPTSPRRRRAVVIGYASAFYLQVRGFIGFSLFGKPQIWTRYTGSSMDLPKSPDKP